MPAVVNRPVIVQPAAKRVKEIHYFGDDQEPVVTRRYVNQVPIQQNMPLAVSLPMAVQPQQIAQYPNDRTKVVRVKDDTGKQSIKDRFSKLVETTDGPQSSTAPPQERVVLKPILVKSSNRKIVQYDSP